MTGEMDLRAKQQELNARRAQQEARGIRQHAPSPALASEIESLMRVARSEPDREAERRVRQRIEQERVERIRENALSPEGLDAWLRGVGVASRHRMQQRSAGLVPGPVRSWCAGFPGALAGASLILAGPTGTGKTTAAVYVLEQAYRTGRPTPNGWLCPSARFVSHPDLFARVFTKQPITDLESCEILVIDDWGMAYESEWPLAVVDRLVDKRWSENLVTIATTNLHPNVERSPRPEDTFERKYPRVWSRLSDAGGPGVVTMAGRDLRLRSSYVDA